MASSTSAAGPFQAIVASARHLALKRGHSQVGTEHLLVQIGLESPEALPIGLSFSGCSFFFIVFMDMYMHIRINICPNAAHQTPPCVLMRRDLKQIILLPLPLRPPRFRLGCAIL